MPVSDDRKLFDVRKKNIKHIILLAKIRNLSYNQIVMRNISKKLRQGRLYEHETIEICFGFSK